MVLKEQKEQFMEKPMIADVQPIKTSLKEGEEYYFCTCGRAKTQPFCDGSHKGTSFKPMKFTAKATTQKWMCACKAYRQSALLRRFPPEIYADRHRNGPGEIGILTFLLIRANINKL